MWLINRRYCPHQFMNIRLCCPTVVFVLPMLFAKIPCRVVVVMMVYSTVAVHMMMRANISVNIVAMVPTGNVNYTADSNTLNWNAYQRSNVMVSCYWGEFVSCVFGGPIVERWGPRKVLSISTIMTSLLTALCVPAAKFDYIAILIVRITLGLCSGVMLPTLHFLISRWAVPMEKGKFVGAIALGTMGIFFSWTICGYVIKYFGWEWAFYVFTIIGLAWTAIWLYVGYDSPDLHPRISLREKNYIYRHIEIADKPKKQIRKPYGRILTSIPVWSLGLLNFGAGWGTFFVITVAPNYIAKALGLNVASTGFLSGAVYLSKSICAMIFSIIGDMLLNRGVATLPVLRKSATIISHILPGLGLLLLLKSGEDPSYYICVIIISMSFYGASALNVYANGHDLTKNFVGTVNGFANSFITAAGIVSPPLTASFTQEEEHNPQVWKPVFYLGSSVFILTGLQFLIFVSTKKQKWDDIPDETRNEKNTNIVSSDR